MAKIEKGTSKKRRFENKLKALKLGKKKATLRKTTVRVNVKPPQKPVPKKGTAQKRPLPKASLKKLPPKKVTPKKAVPKKVENKKPVQLNPVVEGLREAALKVLDERQAEDVVTVSLHGKSSMADYLIVASGRASRQIAAIAHHLREAFEKLGVHPVRVEGLPEGNWVLVDAGDVVIHLFRPDVRRYYDIEDIWQRDIEDREKSARPKD